MYACSPLENVEHEFMYVLVLIKKITEHLLLFQDEDVYTFFEPELPSDAVGVARTKATDGLKLERRLLKPPASRSASKSSQTRIPRPSPNHDKKPTNNTCGNSRRPSPEKISWNVLDLKGENYFSCSVGRTRTNARYILQSSDDVVSFLKELAVASSGSSSS